ncbi:hypothetical protein [Sphingomonas psychrotolerans]|uniref:hypothetical protein n=1 Tax=Sphingomonas psychrotolerans TaxID=1327635 RepID=UPI001F2C263F|nr:hypothetical protein [Sphingomonas psychrotolerans]
MDTLLGQATTPDVAMQQLGKGNDNDVTICGKNNDGCGFLWDCILTRDARDLLASVSPRICP